MLGSFLQIHRQINLFELHEMPHCKSEVSLFYDNIHVSYGQIHYLTRLRPRPTFSLAIFFVIINLRKIEQQRIIVCLRFNYNRVLKSSSGEQGIEGHGLSFQRC